MATIRELIADLQSIDNLDQTLKLETIQIILEDSKTN